MFSHQSIAKKSNKDKNLIQKQKKAPTEGTVGAFPIHSITQCIS